MPEQTHNQSSEWADYFIARRRGGELIAPTWGPFRTRDEAEEFCEELQTAYPEAEVIGKLDADRVRFSR